MDDTYRKIRSIQSMVPNTCELYLMLHKAFTRIPSCDVANTTIRISNDSAVQYKVPGTIHANSKACGAWLALVVVFLP